MRFPLLLSHSNFHNLFLQIAMGKDSIHDRYKEDRESGASVKSFFKALASGSTASGMGHRVYNSADRGSGQMGQQIRDQSGAQIESGRVYVSTSCSPVEGLRLVVGTGDLTRAVSSKAGPASGTHCDLSI